MMLKGIAFAKVIDGTVVTNYLVDSNKDYAQVLEERDGNGNLLVRYVYGHDLISQTRGGATTYYHYDGLGSTRTLTASSEAVTDTYTYDACGLLLEQTGTTENNYLYRGEQFDPELGFYYLRARYMDPNVGRFVTMDSFAGLSRDPYSLHKYLYANANPIRYSDPTGNFSIMETQVGQLIRGLLDRYNTAMKLAKYRVMRGMIVGAVNTMIEKKLTGQDVGLGDVLLGAALGGIFAGAGDAVGAVANRIPEHLLPYLCKLKYLVPVIGGYGLWKEVEGVWEAINMKEYDLAAYRAAQALYTLYELIHLWKSFACFTEETLIYTKEGYRQIKDIEVGDEVYSENMETGEQGLKRVKQIFVRETTVLVHMIVDDVEIKTTPEHPFWVPDKGWIPAGDLHTGDLVKLYPERYGKILSIQNEVLTSPIHVYNFEVEGWHTYLVSKNNVVVHNSYKSRIKTKISSQKQKSHGHLRSHRQGTKGFMESLEDAQEVLDAYHNGNVKVIWEDPNDVVVIVKYEGVAGKYVYNSGLEVDTNIFQIRGTSPHIVPAAPQGKWNP